ncbi:hypothetical protein CRENBAI_009049 [Crenichthys baileyi]|uniref:Uncharacterized protein n=1 Tax=Crenichthys baileyi TaxID=28760 RepID=A0AAV9QRJ5_9TELE
MKTKDVTLNTTACLGVKGRVHGFTSGIIGRIVNWEFSSIPPWGTMCREYRRCRDPSSKVFTDSGTPRKCSGGAEEQLPDRAAGDGPDVGSD